MKFFRNPEIAKSLWIWGIAGMVFTGIGFYMDKWFGVLMLCAVLLFAGLHYVSTYRRYEKLAKLGREIDYILQNLSRFDLSRFAEGELSVLQSQIYKMTVRLREQADNLKKDKIYLADSIADISHQLRTPMTSMHLLLSFLAEEDLTQERRMELCQELRQQMGRIDWLIHTLLKMSRLDAGAVQMAREKVEVEKLVREAAERIAIPMELKEQRLEMQMDGTETFEGDFAWTAEAVGNILKNCMEHTPEGGVIRISARENAVYTELEITDNGPGIAPEDLPRLFERFYKGKQAGTGNVGIGLALAKSIVNVQGGTLKAANGKEGGALFTLRFYKSTV